MWSAAGLDMDGHDDRRVQNRAREGVSYAISGGYNEPCSHHLEPEGIDPCNAGKLYSLWAH